MRFKDYEWDEIDIDSWELAYHSGAGHYIYIVDEYKNNHPFNQTEIDDWNDDRYSVKLRKPMRPSEETLHETDEWQEAEAYVEVMVEDFQD